jgi:hypothetical protein
MGYDARCTLTYLGKTSRGTAWLEHKDLVFRGSTRLAIPLSGITAATARDGSLRVRFGKSTAEFQIGDAAEKWAARIMNPPSRLDKLGVKAGMSVAALNLADAPFLGEVRQRGVTIGQKRPDAAKPVDLIFYCVEHRDGLERLVELSKLINPGGAVWVVRPKGNPNITEAETMAAGKRAGLVDVKVVSFSATHTAEKFVIPIAKRQPAVDASRARSRK